MDNNIISLTKSIMDKMLNEEPIEGKIVTAFTITSDDLTIYTGGEINPENKIATIAEGAKIIDIHALDDFVDSYPRLKLKMLNKEDNSMKYVIARLDRGEDKTIVEKLQFYTKEGIDSAKDPRTQREKLAYLQTPSLYDFTVFQLQVNGYREGMYDKSKRQAFGYHEETNTFVSLGRQPTETFKGGYNRELDFRSLGYEAKERHTGQNISFVKCSVIEKINIEEGLKDILTNKKTGIVILDSLLAPDFINSDFLDLGLTKAVLYTGLTFSHNKPNLLVTTVYGEEKKPGWAGQTKNLKYNMIIDDEDRLSLSDIITLSQSTMVVIAKKVDDVKSLFNSIYMEVPNLYGQFIDSLLYMGSIYKQTGTILTDTSRFLLKEKDFYSFGEVLDTTKTIQRLLGTLTRPNLDSLSIRNGDIKVVNNENIEKEILSINVDDKQITNFLWKIANQEEQKTMITQLDKNGSFTTIYEAEGKISGQETIDTITKLLKVVVFKNETGLNLQASRLVEPTRSRNNDLEVKEGSVILFCGNRGSGKTSNLKRHAMEDYEDKNILIIDEDFDFDHREFCGARQVNIFRSVDTMNLSLVKVFDPDLVIINTNLSKEYLLNIYENINPESIMLLGTTYNIIEDITLAEDKSSRQAAIANKIKSNAKVVHLKKGGLKFE